MPTKVFVSHSHKDQAFVGWLGGCPAPLTEIPEALLAMLRAIDDDVKGWVPIADRRIQSPVEFEWIGLGHALEDPGVKTGARTRPALTPS